ncbi:MAG: SDR family oxidoreductase [Planctomycetaceae bacterium]|nr:SDR family oxidoreductase [Planctomycetaceae bacterium]
MSDKLFTRRTALVTGGARGIGRAVCEMLAAEGARVAVNYQRQATAAEDTVRLLEKSGVKAIAVQADVSKPEDVGRMVETVRRELGPVDLLVNNAGIAESKPHTALTFSRWREMFAVNVDGPFLTTWAVKDEMIARQFGRIVNVSSLAAKVLKPEMIDYATTKATVIALTRHTAAALAPHVRVNCVAPGLTDTEMARDANANLNAQIIAMTLLQRIAQPSEIAQVVRFLLSEESSFVTGQTIFACGGRA